MSPASSRAAARWIAAASLLLAPAAYASKQTHVPDWVRQAASLPSPHLRPHDAAVLLLDQTDITVDEQGRAVVHERKVIKLLTAAGRDYARYPLFYEQGSKVHYLHSWTLGADEHEYQLDDKDVLDSSAVPNFAVFDSSRVRVARALAAEPGAVVAFEDEYVEAPYLTAWRYSLDAEIPSVGRTVSLTLPPGFTYHDGWAHIDPIKPEQLAASSWRWQIGPRASLDDEAASPEMGEVGARMMLAYSGGPVAPADGSWPTVGTWYAGLAKGRDASSPEIAAKVAELTAGKSSFTDKLLAITGFMQDEIRYVAVEMGIGGWQPHAAVDVFHNRYGDCKDKATLLTSMLADAGIVAHPLMVDFDHRIDPAMPSHYANHMITAIEVPPDVQDPRLHALVDVAGKRMLIFDPTNPVSPAGSLEPELQGTYGLLLTGAASVPIQLPVLAPAANLLVRKGTFTLAPDGSISGDLEETRAGTTGDVLRHLYLSGDTRKLEEREELNLRSSLSNFTLSGLVTEHAKDRSTPIEVKFHITANGYAKHAGNLLLIRPAVVGHYLAAGLGAQRPRLYPIALGQEEEVREEYSIELPPGYTTEDLPDPVKLESDFATFENAVRLDAHTLHYSRQLTIRRLEVPAGSYAAYSDFFSKVAAAERDEALLKPAP